MYERENSRSAKKREKSRSAKNQELESVNAKAKFKAKKERESASAKPKKSACPALLYRQLSHQQQYYALYGIKKYFCDFST